MKEWIKYSLYLVILYTLWTIIFEYIIKKYTNCFCVTLATYVVAGILAFIFLVYHIKYSCKHFDNLGDVRNTSGVILVLILFMGLCVLITNKLWSKAIDNNINAGYIGSISNLYIIFVTIISSYLFTHKISNKKVIGIISMLLGTYLIST